MATLLNWPPLPISINTRSRQQAEAFASGANTDQSGAVYRRAIATLAVQHYLRLIDVPHRLETQPSGPALYIEELSGYIGCCAVAPNADRCTVLEEDRENRKGYLFVELSEPYLQANVLGFAGTLSVSQLPLSYLQPLSAFIEALDAATARPAISIADWAKGLAQGWQRLYDLPPALRPVRSPVIAMRGSRPAEPQPTSAAALLEILDTTTNDVIRWQIAERLAKESPETAYTDLSSAVFQVRPLADELGGLAVALLVGIITKPDQTFLVGCRLYSVGGDEGDRPALPEDIVLQGIEEQGNTPGGADIGNQTFCKLTPSAHGDPIEYLLTAEAGDRFSLEVRYLDSVSTSTFVLPTFSS